MKKLLSLLSIVLLCFSGSSQEHHIFIKGTIKMKKKTVPVYKIITQDEEYYVFYGIVRKPAFERAPDKAWQRLHLVGKYDFKPDTSYRFITTHNE